MKKILLVTSTFSEQDSVSSIVKNITATFKLIPNTSVKLIAIEAIPNNFVFSKFDYIAVIHPMVILSPSSEQFWKVISVLDAKILYFVFGDFIRKSAYLIKLDQLLQNKKIHFIAASSAYLKLLEKCLVDKNDVSIIPFPLNSLDFYFDQPAREKFRKKYNLKKNDRALLYTGRVSIQKNIEQLIESFIELKQKFKAGDLKLFIIGNIDDFESPTFYQKKLYPGSYFQRLQKISSLCSPTELYFIPHSELGFLRQAYNGCDLFVSLSLYHDEDFGYSPLEALACGTPAACTSWGGYRDLKYKFAPEASLELIKVDFQENFLQVDNTEIEKKILKSLKSTHHSKARSDFFRKTYSRKAIAKLYQKSLLSIDKRFGGFASSFAEFSLKMLNDETIPAVDYEQMYHSFWKK